MSYLKKKRIFEDHLSLAGPCERTKRCDFVKPSHDDQTASRRSKGAEKLYMCGYDAKPSPLGIGTRDLPMSQ
jgi:hypothetical protein